jgi:hypothetical protein
VLLLLLLVSMGRLEVLGMMMIHRMRDHVPKRVMLVVEPVVERRFGTWRPPTRC